MAGNRLTVHIPQEANPETLIPLLNLMYEQGLTFPDVRTLVAFTEENGLGSRSELPSFATVCDLLHRNEEGHIALSQNGRLVSQLKPDIKAELIHFLMYTGWKDRSRTNTELWAYREIVDFLWFKADVDVLSIGPALNEEVRNKALEMFAADVSFSPKSIRGARKWLSAVLPPVIADKSLFSRRYFCPPESALLATGWVAQQTEGELEIDFLITPERRKMICRVCLLDPAALDRVLDWMLPLYPEVVVAGTNAGVYGRFLRFLKWPELRDLLHQ